MKKSALVLLIVGCAPSLFGSSAQQIVNFDSEQWNIDDPDAEVMFYMNEKSLYLVEGFALDLLRDVDFENGVIEVDVAAHGNPGFAGVVFRYQPEETTKSSISALINRAWTPCSALQHTPVVHGSAAWQLYSGPDIRRKPMFRRTGGFISRSSFPARRRTFSCMALTEPDMTVEE